MSLREFRRWVRVQIFLRDAYQGLRYEVPHVHSRVYNDGITSIQDGRYEDLQLAVLKTSYLFQREELLEELEDVIVRVFWVIKKEVSQLDYLKLHLLVSLLQGFATFGGIQA